MKQVDLFLIVKNVIDEWDPCDLLATHCPSDEYDIETKDIVKKLDSKSNAREIAQIISDIFLKSFNGLFNISIDNCIEPANKIKYLLDRNKNMTIEYIIKIKINNKRRLIIFPEKVSFEHIYRTASGVNWENERKYLYSQIPEEWDYIKWFNHILLNVLSEYNVILQISDKTIFENIDDILKEEFKKENNNFIKNNSVCLYFT